MSKRDELIAVAEKWLGRKEIDDSHKEIIDVYNEAARRYGLYIMKYTDPWCAAFVTACAWKCGLTSIIAPSASCDAMINWYKSRGRWKDKNSCIPKKADIVFYDWDQNGTSDHVGIIVSISGSTIKVIEGNNSDSVCYRTIPRTWEYIKGYGIPNYPSQVQTTPVEEMPEVLPTPKPVKIIVKSCNIALPLLKKGDGMGDRIQYKPYVESLQQLLIAKGYSCGSAKDDGEFGPATDTALRNYQLDKKLTVDGKAGVEVYNSLWGG